jgi:hypothetical protein
VVSTARYQVDTGNRGVLVWSLGNLTGRKPEYLSRGYPIKAVNGSEKGVKRGQNLNTTPDNGSY